MGIKLSFKNTLNGLKNLGNIVTGKKPDYKEETVTKNPDGTTTVTKRDKFSTQLILEQTIYGRDGKPISTNKPNTWTGVSNTTILDPEAYYESYLGDSPENRHNQAETDWKAGKYGQDRKAFLEARMLQIEGLIYQYLAKLDEIARRLGKPSWQSVVSSISTTVAGAVGVIPGVGSLAGTAIKGIGVLIGLVGLQQSKNEQQIAQQNLTYLQTQLQYLQAEYIAYESELSSLKIRNYIPYLIITGAVLVVWKKKKGKVSQAS